MTVLGRIRMIQAIPSREKKTGKKKIRSVTRHAYTGFIDLPVFFSRLLRKTLESFSLNTRKKKQELVYNLLYSRVHIKTPQNISIIMIKKGVTDACFV
jgi:hypothetical protein